MLANKSWADITVIGGGVPFLEIQSLEYTRNRKIEDHFGAGDKVVSRGYGNVEDTGLKFKMSVDELVRIQATAPNNDITLIPPFTVSVVWKPTAQNATTFTDVLTNCQFTSNGRDLKQGDTKHFTMIDGIFAGFNDPQ